jgi:hypothetical protein
VSINKTRMYAILFPHRTCVCVLKIVRFFFYLFICSFFTTFSFFFFFFYRPHKKKSIENKINRCRLSIIIEKKKKAMNFFSVLFIIIVEQSFGEILVRQINTNIVCIKKSCSSSSDVHI